MLFLIEAKKRKKEKKTAEKEAASKRPARARVPRGLTSGAVGAWA